MSVQERWTYSVRYLDGAGKHRQKTYGRGEEGRIKAYKLESLIKEQKQAEKEAMRDSEIMASTMVQFFDSRSSG